MSAEARQSAEQDEMLVAGERAADRLLRSQKLEPTSPYLHGDAPPTPAQVGAVLHALADHTLLSHMNSESVLLLGDDRAHLGGTWRAATAHGRFLQRMGQEIEWRIPPDSPRADGADQ